ncbi:MAG: UDP-2,3-diacylglucosamine diphosphatase [Candidatus Cloacimonetes bacterium]|nr:UDP-2,3-diacylglucosamine diphosphatase [Candidatus Cloacimonadota bacterium]
MKIYIASDFHLKFQESREDLQRRERVQVFLRSLIGKADVLILNGDIFDLWFVWKKVIIKSYFPILKILADIRESGCRIIFIAGNHDFWFGDFLSNYLDIEVYQDSFSGTLDGLKMFVTHGDQYTTNDKRYQIFRAFIRNRIITKTFETLHPDFALSIGSKLSRSSRRSKIPISVTQKRENGLIDFAKKKVRDNDLIVMGHSHLPKKIEFEKGIYVNSGDWIKHNTYVKIIDGKIELKEFIFNSE